MKARGFGAIVVAGSCIAAAGACVYRFDPFLADLAEGDVVGRAVGVPPRQQGALGPLPDAIATLKGSAVVRRTVDDGRFAFRNLPPGDWIIRLNYDEDRDGIADLVGRVAIPMRVPEGRTQRPKIDLGDVVLLRPGKVTGRVVLPTGVAPEMVRVVLPGHDAQATPASDGTFEIGGLGAGDWEIVAAGPGSITPRVAFTLGEAQTHDVGELQLATSSVGGSVQGEIRFPPERAQALTADPTRILLVPLSFDEQTISVQPSLSFFQTQVPAGIWGIQVEFGQDVQPVLHVFEIVEPDRATVVELIATPIDIVVGCFDLDGDGQCYLRDGQQHPECEAFCGTNRAPAEACTADPSGTVYDCDDDSDLQSDVAEWTSCHCGLDFAITDPADPTCDGNPLRYDLDGDGVCDIMGVR